MSDTIKFYKKKVKIVSDKVLNVRYIVTYE